MDFARKKLPFVFFTLLIVVLSGCTSTRSYNLDQLNADIPLRPGQRVTVVLNNQLFTRYELTVVSVNKETLYGNRVDDSGESVVLRWDEISRIDARSVDGGKATLWAVIAALLLLVYVAQDIADDIDDTFSGND